MAEELEILWQRLKVTEEEEESISLGAECTRAAVERGKKCVFMKVLSRKGLMVEALRKNIRMLWKPNKNIQLSVIGDELFLVEFEDERDRRRVMDMRPWHYEKQLVLFQEFEGDKNPKDILLKWSPFWVQVYNLPLKSRTKETGKAIGESIGKFIEVDVEDTGVQWGTCLRVRVEIDVTKKLIRGQKVNMENGETRWVHFKYKRLPNFCYRCGLLEHDLKDCMEEPGNDKAVGKGELQYGAWLRGEQIRKGGWEFGFAKKKLTGEMKNRAKPTKVGQNGMAEVREGAVRETQELEAICLGEGKQEKQGDMTGGCEVTTGEKVETGMAESIGRSYIGELVEVGEENWEVGKGSGGKEACLQGGGLKY